MNTTWLEVHQKFIGASRSFHEAVALYCQGQDNAPPGCRAPMACLRAMLAGHTLLESGLRQILIACAEEIPSERGSDGVLLQHAACATDKRPPILEADTLGWALETGRLRDFLQQGAPGAVRQSADDLVMAARMLSERLVPGYLQFLKISWRQKS